MKGEKVLLYMQRRRIGLCRLRTFPSDEDNFDDPIGIGSHRAYAPTAKTTAVEP